ncbi:MAG: respiratory nitrate reductase subunit beta [Myxococcota bacterium]|jgi:ethylbenzene hydroxylase subunit beta/complex iron-sulfur molybdoenzyme family reductase subunit beta|nr:respiratory nitrate reductase subunit beta [Myxococcota bacterium]
MGFDPIGRSKNGEVTGPERQLAMVFDLNKCLGCHTCSMACKTQWTRDEGMESMWWTVVNTMPGRGTPKDWETSGGGFDEAGTARAGRLPTREEFGEAWKFNHDEVLGGNGKPDAHLAPKGDPKWGPNWDEDQGDGEFPNSYFFYLPRICNHCTHPACLEACPRGAIKKRAQDGVVLIDEEDCRGYRFCMEACPYKRIYFNAAKAASQKCIFCYPRLEKGVAPACARQCPGRMRHVGFLDDEQSSVHKLVRKFKVALPLHPEFGTQPNVYYIPPFAPPPLNEDGSANRNGSRIPLDYLRGLFGKRVDEALATIEAEIQKRRDGEKSELLDTLIVYSWPQDIFPDFDGDPSLL